MIKTDDLGDTLWTRTYGGTSDEAGYCVQQTIDEGYLITGRTESYGAGLTDVWLIKTDSQGDTLWTIAYGGTDNDYGSFVQQTTDEGYIISGRTHSFTAGVYDVWLIKTDDQGDTLWTRTYGGASWDEGKSVQQTSDGGYIIGGRTESYRGGLSDIWLIKTDNQGDTLWTQTFGGVSNEYVATVEQTTDGGYIIGGFTLSYGVGNYDVWLIKTATDPNLIKEKDKINFVLNYRLYQNYPNPFNPTTQVTYTLSHPNNVSLVVYDLLGKEVQTLMNDYQTAGSYSVDFDASQLSSGIYLYQLKVGNDFVATKKMILAR